MKLEAGTADKVRKLLEALGELRGKEAAILSEINALMGGGVGIGELLKQAETSFAHTWGNRYKGAYVWQYAKDRPNMKRLIGMLGIEELRRRFDIYVRNDDPFYVKVRHSFGAFVSSVNQHAGPGEAQPEELALSSPIVNCVHVPPCQNDMEHTQRRAADMRV